MVFQQSPSNRPPLFHQTQRFRQPWLWAIVLAPTIFLVGVLVYTVVTGEQFGEKPVPLPVLIVLTLLMCFVVFGFYRAGLTTTVDEEGMSYGWNLFGPKLNRLHWRDVRAISLIRYRFVGYGVRASRDYGTIHNVSGEFGVLIERKGEGKFMIGTNRPEEMDAAIRRVVESYPHIVYADTIDTGAATRSSTGFDPIGARPDG